MVANPSDTPKETIHHKYAWTLDTSAHTPHPLQTSSTDGPIPLLKGRKTSHWACNQLRIDADQIGGEIVEHHRAEMNLRNKALIVLLCMIGTDVILRGYVLRRFTEYTLPQDASPCTKLLSESERRRMHCCESVELFLSADYELPEDAFNWWKRLQLERRNFSAYTETVGRLFEMIPPCPGLSEPRPNRCRTCALVGNSVNLKGSHYGPEIDSHDIVIRINHGRTKGYEADVGTRTTHHIMYPESAVDLDNSTHLVLVPFKIQDLEWLMKAFTTGFYGKSYVPVKSHIAANEELVMVVNPAFMRCVHDSWLSKKGQYPSTGFMALILALRVCDEVHVFGYGADDDGNWSHYWEKLEDKKFKTGIHPGTHEYSIIQKLAEQQKLKFYKGC
uniref:CMP-N-acetylneuraminate-beta-galactosamide-alpha-2,3-sialyltransferase 2 n=2 Tax=Sparus aurata TaxID=8175 RepID=A0A671UST1_SPAAU